MIEKITTEELDMMETYRDKFAAQASMIEDRKVPMTQILEEWASAKEKLFKIFHGELILTKNIEVALSKDVLQDKMGHLLYSQTKEEIVDSFTYLFSDMLSKILNKAFDYLDYFEWNRYNSDIYTFFSTNTFVNNKLEKDVFFPATEYNEAFTLKQGMKAIKALQICLIKLRLMDLEGVSQGFERFRILHSQILNKKTMKGQLCLSIHPLDYMTMSDNNNNWSSCMSWQHKGCYKQGTVEMMNSPFIIVGYLKSDYKTYTIGNHEWNSKKWRCLYFVQNNFIMNIKQYPFNHTEINELCLTWLKELVEKAYPNLRYTDNFIIRDEDGEEKDEDEDDYYEDNYYPFIDTGIYGIFKPRTVMMYNDFCHGGLHTGYANITNRNIAYEINYSGNRQCMCCGGVEDDFYPIDEIHENEGMLICSKCETIKFCALCGNRIDNAFSYTVDGEDLCSCCYEAETHLDSFTQERHLTYNMKHFTVVDNEEDKNYLFSLFVYDQTKFTLYLDNIKKFAIQDYYCQGMRINTILLSATENIHSNIWSYLTGIKNPSLDDIKDFIKTYTTNKIVKYILKPIGYGRDILTIVDKNDKENTFCHQTIYANNLLAA